MTIHDAQVVHFLPGRIRLKSAQFKGNPALAQEVQQTLLTLPGVLSVEAQPTTGSVLVLYDSANHLPLPTLAEAFGWSAAETTPEHLEDWLRTSVRSASPGLATDLRAMFGGANTGAAYVTGGWADLRTLAPLALILLGIRSLLVTSPLPVPQWYDFFWFAFGIFMALNPVARTPPADTASA